MRIDYKVNGRVTTEQFISLLQESTLAERRPIEDLACMEGMLANSNLVVSAWLNEQLIGIARSMTDFHYACYLSDLAVDRAHQHKGVGIKLQRLTREQLGAHCKLILIAAPAAETYYENIGFTRNERCWVLAPGQRLSV